MAQSFKNSNAVFEAVWQVVTRRTLDRATATAELCERLLHAEGRLHRDDQRLYAGERELNRDREVLPRLSKSAGLGICLYLGNRRIATSTVLDAGTAPELDGFAPAPLVDAAIRRREVFKGTLSYTGRQYLVVGRPLFAGEGQDYAPLGMIEVFQDEQAFMDLMAAAARTGLEAEVSDMDERRDAMESLTHFIDDVARRLQLLALNGNIIAAQAGVHGRAFRVVCRELGALADQAKQSAEDSRDLARLLGLERDDDSELELGAGMPSSAGVGSPE